MLWGPPRWESSLLGDPGANFSLENGGHAQKEKRQAKKKSLFAMRTVELNQAMSGREGAQLPPLPPAPPNPADRCHCDVLLRHQHQKGTLLIS